MSSASQLSLALKAFRQLGPRQVGWYAWYRLGLRSGSLRRLTPESPNLAPGSPDWRPADAQLLKLPDPAELEHLLGRRAQALFAEADEIVAGKVRLFGGAPVPLQLTSPGRLVHWTELALDAETGSGEDIKYTWEPGRFGWVFTLGRAYHLGADERYAEAFWRQSEIFLGANPPNLGVHWASAQEVALRLMALVFGAQVFAGSAHSTEPRLGRLTAAIAAHAARLPATIAYALAQNNNHLLSEAAGLITASHFLPNHPTARHWKKTGWKFFNRGLANQIATDGSYTQHSSNYHRLMLQLALWVQALGEPLPQSILDRLISATGWLSRLVDSLSGHTPNLGPNDGAHFLPLSTCPIDDFRPTVQAACLAFTGTPAYPAGPWDELPLWLGIGRTSPEAPLPENQPAMSGESHQPAVLLHEHAEQIQAEDTPPSSGEATPTLAPAILRHAKSASWAYLRAAHFDDRPGHADQLHVDLWWLGLNITLDPGTYLYNGLPPWDNPLSGTAYHNTVMINGQDQMRRAGRFLWLDWAQAEICQPESGDLPGRELQDNQMPDTLCAQHYGFRRLGAIHRRTVSVESAGNWIVNDELLPTEIHQQGSISAEETRSTPGEGATSPRWSARLHWLLPDWEWELKEDSQKGIEAGVRLRLRSPSGWICLVVSFPEEPEISATRTSLCRAGETLSGEAPCEPTRGWFSPTYGYKFPALSFAVEVDTPHLPLSLRSEFLFPSV